jgi:tetratricopeptide (TPR) repeat protein
MALFEQALRLDPTSIVSMTGLAKDLIADYINFHNTNGDALNRAAKLIADAAAINPDDQGVLDTTAYLVRAQGRYAEAIAAYRRLLEEYPNSYWAYSQIGMLLMFVGRAEEGLPMVEKAIRRDPLGPNSVYYYGNMGKALMLLGRDEESIPWNRRALAATPNIPSWQRALYDFRLVAAYARLGHLDEAHSLIVGANRIWPWETVRSEAPDNPYSRIYGPVYAEQFKRYDDALRLAGVRDHADENADFGVAPDNALHAILQGRTPTTVPGAKTIRTPELQRFLVERKPVIVDTMFNWWGFSLTGAVALQNSGWGGSMSDTMQDRLRRKMQEVTKGDLSVPIVVVGWNSERFDSYNLALRLAALGYTQVHWYRGGREAWEVAGLPETEVDAQDW